MSISYFLFLSIARIAQLLFMLAIIIIINNKIDSAHCLRSTCRRSHSRTTYHTCLRNKNHRSKYQRRTRLTQSPFLFFFVFLSLLHPVRLFVNRRRFDWINIKSCLLWWFAFTTHGKVFFFCFEQLFFVFIIYLFGLLSWRLNMNGFFSIYTKRARKMCIVRIRRQKAHSKSVRINREFNSFDQFANGNEREKRREKKTWTKRTLWRQFTTIQITYLYICRRCVNIFAWMSWTVRHRASHIQLYMYHAQFPCPYVTWRDATRRGVRMCRLSVCLYMCKRSNG